MKYILITIFAILVILYILKNYTENFKDCISYFNENNLSNKNNNRCMTYFKEENEEDNNLCNELIKLGWNPNWKQSDLFKSDKLTQKLNKKIYNKLGTITTNDIKKCFKSYI
jgi:hypothetical protein